MLEMQSTHMWVIICYFSIIKVNELPLQLSRPGDPPFDQFPLTRSQARKKSNSSLYICDYNADLCASLRAANVFSYSFVRACSEFILTAPLLKFCYIHLLSWRLAINERQMLLAIEILFRCLQRFFDWFKLHKI